MEHTLSSSLFSFHFCVPRTPQKLKGVKKDTQVLPVVFCELKFDLHLKNLLELFCCEGYDGNHECRHLPGDPNTLQGHPGCFLQGSFSEQYFFYDWGRNPLDLMCLSCIILSLLERYFLRQKERRSRSDGIHV